MSKPPDELRNDLITKVRYGQITPEEAEAQAKAGGLPPFASQPEFTEFDPMKESRWTLVMAIAWIAWRDPQLVMEQGAEFRSLSTHWIYRDWNEPVDGGQAFAQRSGWLLKTWHQATAARLSIHDLLLRRRGSLPPSAHFTPSEAEQELWRALSDNRLKAEAFDRSGALIEIPDREWTHLQLFEEGAQDVVKYNALDRDEPFRNVRFRRDDLIRLWPRSGAKAISEAECRRWLAAHMRESPVRRPRSKSAFKQEALVRFHPISARQFLSAWNAAIEETAAIGWKSAGRPPRKSNHSTK